MEEDWGGRAAVGIGERVSPSPTYPTSPLGMSVDLGASNQEVLSLSIHFNKELQSIEMEKQARK